MVGLVAFGRTASLVVRLEGNFLRLAESPTRPPSTKTFPST